MSYNEQETRFFLIDPVLRGKGYYFFIGGLMIPDFQALGFEKTLSQISFNFFGSRTMTAQTELHGKYLFHGKGNAKKRKRQK